MLGVFRTSFARPLLALRVSYCATPTVNLGHTRIFLTTPILSAAAATTKAKATKKPATEKPAAKKAVAKEPTAKKAAAKTVSNKKASVKPKKEVKKPKKPILDIPKDQLPPKHPNLPFRLFIASQSIINPCRGKEDMPEWSRRQSEVWKGMSDAEKAPFYKRYEQSRAEYTKAVQEWINKTPESVISQYRRFYRKKGKTPSISRAALAGREGRVKVGGSGYTVFFKDQYRELSNDFPAGTNMTVKMKVIAAKWRALSESEKDVYRQRYTERKNADLATNA